MLGDSISDAYGSMLDAICVHYNDEYNNLPAQLRRQLLDALAEINLVRNDIDSYQIRKVTS
jgi:hypothetical protein